MICDTRKHSFGTLTGEQTDPHMPLYRLLQASDHFFMDYQASIQISSGQESLWTDYTTTQADLNLCRRRCNKTVCLKALLILPSLCVQSNCFLPFSLICACVYLVIMLLWLFYIEYFQTINRFKDSIIQDIAGCIMPYYYKSILFYLCSYDNRDSCQLKVKLLC